MGTNRQRDRQRDRQKQTALTHLTDSLFPEPKEEPNIFWWPLTRNGSPVPPAPPGFHFFPRSRPRRLHPKGCTPWVPLFVSTFPPPWVAPHRLYPLASNLGFQRTPRIPRISRNPRSVRILSSSPNPFDPQSGPFTIRVSGLGPPYKTVEKCRVRSCIRGYRGESRPDGSGCAPTRMRSRIHIRMTTVIREVWFPEGSEIAFTTVSNQYILVYNPPPLPPPLALLTIPEGLLKASSTPGAFAFPAMRFWMS